MKLQWGHGDEAVEELGGRGVAAGLGVASMGHGDEAVEEASPSPCLTRWLRLQWGHGDEAVEERPAAWSGPASTRELQWGHGDEAVEEFRLSAGPAGVRSASMGPRR